MPRKSTATVYPPFFTKGCSVDFKVADVTTDDGGSTRLVKGLASTWDRDLGGDRFKKGTFAKTIQNDFPQNRIKGYREHKRAIGLPVVLKETNEGLYTEIEIKEGDSVDGDETIRLAQSKVYDAFSVAYIPDPNGITYTKEDGLRTRILSGDTTLVHIGILDDPMNQAALIEDVKRRDLSQKGLWSIADAVNQLAWLESVKKWGELTPDEAPLVEDLISVLTENYDQLKNRISVIKAVSVEKKNLWDIAEAMQYLAALESIKRWGELTPEDAEMVLQLIEVLTENFEQAKSRLPNVEQKQSVACEGAELLGLFAEFNKENENARTSSN